MDVLGEEKVQLQGYSCVKPKSSLGSPPCTLTSLSCGERGALPNGLWGGCSACLAARLPLGDFQQSIRYFLMMPLQSTRGSHLPSVCGPPLPKGPGSSVFTDAPVVEREEIAKKESAVEEGCLGNQEGKG